MDTASCELAWHWFVLSECFLFTHETVFFELFSTYFLYLWKD